MSFHTEDQRERVVNWVVEAAKNAQHYVRMLRDPDFPPASVVKDAFGEFGDEAVNWITELDEVASRVCKQLGTLCKVDLEHPF